MIAAAVFSYTLQICGYNTPRTLKKYPSGTARGILGLQWVLFAIGAAVEYEISSRSRRQSVRRQEKMWYDCEKNYLTLTSATSSICIDKPEKQPQLWLNVMV